MEVRITQAPMETTQLLGHNVTFSCTATGIPLPNITWSSDNDDVTIYTTVLDDSTIFSEISLVSITVEDFVNYTCSAMNIFNTVNESAILINASTIIISDFRIIMCCYVIYHFSNTNNHSTSSRCYGIVGW